MKNVLIVGAHYDDAELGCGGTAAKLASEGKNVYKLTLTNNVTRFEQMNIRVEYEKSVKESALACEILGVHEIDDFPPAPCNHVTYFLRNCTLRVKISGQRMICTIKGRLPLVVNGHWRQPAFAYFSAFSCHCAFFALKLLLCIRAQRT